jgi:hypothetical protein
MNITQIEENIKQLTTDFHAGKVVKKQFVYDFLLAYGHRKSSVSRVKSGERNLSKVAGEVRWKRHVYFKHIEGDNLRLEADKLKNDKVVVRDRIRFVIVTDFNKFLAIDIKTGDSLDIKLDEIVKHFDFFLPWAGMEKAVYQGENPADVKAAEKMAELFDIIKADNFNEANKNNTEALHNLNVFLTRLLFCFFAEDTDIFTSNQFSHAIESHTNIDGTDVSVYLNRLFNVLNTADANRCELPDYLARFPFVNGGLFAKELPTPVFSTKSRRMLIECGRELNWSDINPDIFGSMIQAVVHPDQRGGMGMHYTSVTNIMKVIEPLFLDELYEELENIQFNIDEKLKPSRLRKLKERLSKIKIFDPACGSGNFLIIAFKELRKLEMDMIKLLQEIEDDKHHNQDDLFAEVGLDSSFSEIKLSQFYGIELDDFAHEVAILSLWLAEHQMNVEFKTEFGECEATLPLTVGGSVVQGNATLVNWKHICPPNNSEVYLVGNPPYLGSKVQNKKQKEEVISLFDKDRKCKTYDYILCWFYKASQYISNQNAKFSFVSTNSITQGEQVAFWKSIYKLGLEICFAHTSFLWKNHAKSNAAVMCVIIGIRNRSRDRKLLYTLGLQREVSNINSYLVNAPESSLERISKPISDIPLMLFGSIAYDGGNLFLTDNEKNELAESIPELSKFIRPAVGAIEMLRGIKRWCIWIKDEELEEALSNPFIKGRLEKVREFRLESKTPSTQKFADLPHRFKQNTYKEGSGSILIIPRVSSERRDYIPLSFFKGETITVDAQVIYDATLFLFGILSSKIHTVWVKLTSGRMKSDIRYSSAVSYNNFPIPNYSEEKLKTIENASLGIIEARELYPQMTLAQLYDPNKMPLELRNAHLELDIQIENIYSEKIIEDDEERLRILFGLYNKMTGGQNA